MPWYFSDCEKGERGQAAAYKPTERMPVSVVGRLGETVTEKCLLLPEAVSVKGANIHVPVKYVRYRGRGREGLSPRVVYVMAKLPPLSAGKYRVTVVFIDYSYGGDKSKIQGPIAKRPYHRLTCDVTVRKALALSWGKPANGVQVGLSAEAKSESGKAMYFTVCVKNKGKKSLRFRGASATREWDLAFAPKDGGIPYHARNVVRYAPLSPDTVLRSGQRQKIPLGLGGPRWVFVRGAKWDWDAPSVQALPPGKYTVTASYEHAAGHGDDEACQYWHGKITAGAVEIEIKPKAKVKK